MTSSWNQSGLTWNNQPKVEERVTDYNYMRRISREKDGYWKGKQGYSYWNITRLAKDWYENPSSNYGVMLKASNESAASVNTAYAIYCMPNHPDAPADAYPSLTVQYLNNLGLEEYWTYHSGSVGANAAYSVNDYTGNLVVTSDDISIPGNRLPYTIRHVYNSGSATVNTGYGNGWRLNICQTVTDLSKGTAVDKELYENGYSYRYVDEDGTELYFKKSDGKDETGKGLTIKKSGSSYVITDKKDNTLTFNASGWLTEIRDTSGNTIQISHNSAGQPTKVTTATGKAITLNYTAVGGLLADIQATAFSQSVRYDYTSSNTLSWSDRSDDNNIGYRYTGGRLDGLQEQRSGVAVVFDYTAATGKRISSVKEYGDTTFSLNSSRAGVLSGLTAAHMGQELKIEYGNYETRLYTSGKDDVMGNGDDVVDAYQFDNAGRTTCVTSATRDGKEQLGATNTVYGEKDGDQNRVTASAEVSKTALNLLEDPGFERNKSGWEALDEEAVGVSVSRTTSATLYGNYAGKVTVSTQNSGIDGYGQTITGLTPGKHYVLSGYVKASGVTGTGACIQFTSFGMTSLWQRFTSSYETGTTSSEVNGGWRRVWVDFEVPADAIGFSVSLGIMKGKGTAYFDGVQLEEGTVPSAYNLVDNASFERGDLTDLHGWEAVPNVNGGNTLSNTGHSGEKGYMLQGSPTGTPAIEQTIALGSENKSVFKVSGWMKAEALPVKDVENEGQRKVGLQVRVNYADGAVKDMDFAFNPFVSDWQYVSGIIDCDNKSTSKVSSIRIRGVYEKQANTAYFDDFQLIRDEAGSYTYDKDGNLISAKENAEQQSRREYADNDLTKLTDAKGNVYTYEYDDKHRVTKAVSQRNVANSFTYDSYGNIKTSVVTGSGTTEKINTSAAYTGDGNYMSQVTDARGNKTEYTYETDTGLLAKVKDAKGNAIQYYYNSKSLLPELVTSHANDSLAANRRVDYFYNDKWQLEKISRNATAYSFTYDLFGNLLQTKVGSQTLSTNTYNARNGKLTKVAYGNGSRVETEYDGLDRAVSRKVNGEERYAWRYGTDGNIGQLEDKVIGVRHVYEYDTTGRLQREVVSDGSELYYGYDVNNNVTKAAYKGGGETRTNTHSYGKDNLLEKSALAGGMTAEYGYDGLGRISRRTNKLGSGSVRVNYAYESGAGSSGTTTQVYRESWYQNNGLKEMYDYSYDETGSISEILETGEGRYTYTYDDIGQLTRVDDSYAGITTVYEYDVGGNIKKKTEYELNKLTGSGKVVNYTYGDSEWKDLLTSYKGSSILYDGIGNPIKYYDAKSLFWTGRELDKVIYGGSGSCTYKYNEEGIRTEKAIYGKETHKYLLEGSRIIREEILDSGGKRKHLLWYNYDGNGVLTGVEYDGVKYLYKVSQQGDVLGLYDTTGKLVVKYRYDAWGKLKELTDGSGKTITDTESIGIRNPFRYRGYYYDTDTGWYYLNARYYDPETGRFLNADGYASTGQGIVGHNMFVYCNNNPVMNADYTGNMPCSANCLFPDQQSHSIDLCRAGAAGIALGGLKVSLSNGWSYHIDPENSGKGEKRHIHVEKGGKKYSQNNDGSPHKGSKGSPPKSVKKELKNKIGWDWDKKTNSYKYSFSPLVMHIEGCNTEEGECECGVGYPILWDQSFFAGTPEFMGPTAPATAPNMVPHVFALN